MMIYVPATTDAGGVYIIALRSYAVIMIVSQLVGNHEFVVMIAAENARP
jgi:hypothetical protein